MSVLGPAGLFKPALRLGSRLFASQTERTKSVGNDQHHVFPSNHADCVPMASYHRTEALPQFPSCNLANNFVMMQPVLVPVFPPSWGHSCTPSFVQMPAEPQSQVTEVHQQRRQRRSRRGGAAMRKKLDRALCPEDLGGAAEMAAAEKTATERVAAQKVAVEVAAKVAAAKAAAGKAAAAKVAAAKVAAAQKAVAAKAAAEKVAAEKVATEKLLAAETGTVMMSLAGVAQGRWSEMVRDRSGSNCTPGRWADYDDEDNSFQALQIHAGTDTLDVASADMADTSSAQLQRTSTSISEEDAGRREAAIDPLLLELDSADETSRQFALDWVANSFWPLALTKRGCRIVQKAIDVGTPAYQKQLVENLHGRVSEAVKSPHTNYVLQKFIETLPPERMQFVLTELQGEGPNVSRHRFGCRIIQRLIEHCPPSQTEPLINEILCDAASLCLHQYGNFSIQHILQHGSPPQRSAIAEVVEADIIRLAKHRIASHVVSSAMVHCPVEDVQRLTHTVLRDAGKLAHLSRREYGSFVVREVNRAARKLRA